MSELTLNFRCADCKLRFESENFTIEQNDQGGLDHYFAECPQCNQMVPQLYWERNLMKAHRKATGPQTAEGKAKVRENLRGHPTKEATKWTRWNAMYTGAHAQAGAIFPAKPGKYPNCKTCEVDKKWCASQLACKTKTELFLLYHVAWKTGNPELLAELASRKNAMLEAISSDMMLGVISEGVTLRQPQFFVNPKTGECDLVRDEQGDVVKTVLAHPLLKYIPEYMKIANQQPADFNMTRRQQGDQNPVLNGFLNGGNEDLSEYHERQTQSLAQLETLILESRQATLNDPVYLEYREDSADDNTV